MNALVCLIKSTWEYKALAHQRIKEPGIRDQDPSWRALQWSLLHFRQQVETACMANNGEFKQQTRFVKLASCSWDKIRLWKMHGHRPSRLTLPSMIFSKPIDSCDITLVTITRSKIHLKAWNCYLNDYFNKFKLTLLGILCCTWNNDREMIFESNDFHIYV